MTLRHSRQRGGLRTWDSTRYTAWTGSIDASHFLQDRQQVKRVHESISAASGGGVGRKCVHRIETIAARGWNESRHAGDRAQGIDQVKRVYAAVAEAAR